MTPRLFIGFCVGCTLLLSGCAPMELTPEELAIKPQAKLERQADRSLVVPLSKVRKEFRSHWVEMPMQELDPQLFHDALVTTLRASGLFHQVAVSGDADYSLRSEVIVQRLTGMGLMLLFVRYELIEIASGRPVWEENLLTYRNLTAADVFTAWDRVRQVTQMTMQGHMGDLIAKLDEVMEGESYRKPGTPEVVGAPVLEPTITVTPKIRKKAEIQVKKEPELDVSYPHKLTGKEISAHFKRYKHFTFDRVPNTDFTINMRSKAYLERICPECNVEHGIGSMRIKVSPGLVCFDWDMVSYPSSTCFELIQIETNRYQLVDPVDGETYGYVVP